MEIHTSSFCSISRSEDWQKWLKETAPDLHQSLQEVIDSKRGCRANTNKMQDIYFELYQRNLGNAFESFVKRRFPWLIKSENKPPKERQTTTRLPRVTAPYKKVNLEDLNKHKVFKYYKPNLLQFPQKLIILGHPDTLFQQVQNFVQDKLAIDYLILEDRAYIEYFLPKYATIVDRYPRERREIYQYRRRMAQDG